MCVLQSHLVKFRNVLKGVAVIISFINNSLWLTLVDGLTPNVLRAATSHSVYLFAPALSGTIIR